jgi:hypothetical protein
MKRPYFVILNAVLSTLVVMFFSGIIIAVLSINVHPGTCLYYYIQSAANEPQYIVNEGFLLSLRYSLLDLLFIPKQGQHVAKNTRRLYNFHFMVTLDEPLRMNGVKNSFIRSNFSRLKVKKNFHFQIYLCVDESFIVLFNSTLLRFLIGRAKSHRGC